MTIIYLIYKHALCECIYIHDMHAEHEEKQTNILQHMVVESRNEKGVHG